jgi:hypothetical protein
VGAGGRGGGEPGAGAGGTRIISEAEGRAEHRRGCAADGSVARAHAPPTGRW